MADKFLFERIAELKTPEQILDAIAQLNKHKDWQELVDECKPGEVKRLTALAMHEFAQQQAITYYIAMDKRTGPHCFLDDSGHEAWYKMFLDKPESICP